VRTLLPVRLAPPGGALDSISTDKEVNFGNLAFHILIGFPR